jgi:hypothetical protein
MQDSDRLREAAKVVMYVVGFAPDETTRRMLYRAATAVLRVAQNLDKKEVEDGKKDK